MRAAPLATVSRQPMLPQLHGRSPAASTRTWLMSPALPLAPSCGRPAEMTPLPMPRPALTTTRWSSSGRATRCSPTGHHRGVVVDGDGEAEAFGEHVAQGVAVPARHAGGAEDAAGAGLHGAGEGDAERPHRTALLALAGDEPVDLAAEPVDGGVGARGDVVRQVDGIADGAADVDDAEPRVVAAEVRGDGHSSVRGDAQQPGPAAAAGGALAGLGEEPGVDEFLHPQGDRRGGEAEFAYEVGS